MTPAATGEHPGAGEGAPPAQPRGVDAPPPAPPPGVKAMAIVRWVLVALAAIVAGGSILHFARERLDPAKRVASGRIYYCPMHPSVVQDHPGECPICSMTLVPKPPAGAGPTRATNAAPVANAVPGLTGIDLTPERIQLIGMRTAPVTREALGGELRATGAVEPNERGLAQIGSRFTGWIQSLSVATTGERVRRGQILATIYSPDVLRAEQELLVARGWTGSGASDAKPNRERDDFAAGIDASARRRLELLGISPQEIDEVLRTGKAAEAIAIRSPVDGYVVSKDAVAGVAVQPGTVLFRVADLSEVWVTADVYEQDISRVQVGQRGRLELSAFPGEAHTGRVKLITPVLDPEKRTLQVRLEFKNRFDRNGPRLRPGMYGTVFLDLPATSGLTVPASAIVDTGETRYLFVAREGGHFEPRLVKTGARVAGRVEILGGVAEGEIVVTTGNFLVDSESRLRAAVERETDQPRRTSSGK